MLVICRGFFWVGFFFGFLLFVYLGFWGYFDWLVGLVWLLVVWLGFLRRDEVSKCHNETAALI